MDKTEKNRRKKRINEIISAELAALGFRKTKPCWFVRPFPLIAEFMHLHFYTNGNDIRIHLGWRVLNDTFPALALNGPHFDSGARSTHINPETKRRYNFGYNIIGHKEEEAAKEVSTFFREVAIPYFTQLSAKNWSSLPLTQKQLLGTEPVDEATKLSLSLLKLT